MTRSLYRSLLWLHPPAFRREFGGEMLWIFDEAAATEGASRLLADGVISLVRQWLVGCGAWKVMIAVAIAVLQVLFFASLGVPSHPGPPQPLPSSVPPSEFAFSYALLPLVILLAWMMTALRVLHARTSSRH